MAESTRLPPTIPLNPSYEPKYPPKFDPTFDPKYESKYEIPASYPPTSLFPSVSSVPISHHVTHHQVSPPVTVSSSTYQQPGHHQLPPTPNSLVTMMGPNSGNSNPATEQLTSSELSIGSVSPIHPVQHIHNQGQQQPLQTHQGNKSPPSWNLPISSGPRIGLPPTPPTSLPQTQIHSSANHHQAFAGHYTTSGFQQSGRPAPTHQPFYGWYWRTLLMMWEKYAPESWVQSTNQRSGFTVGYSRNFIVIPPVG